MIIQNLSVSNFHFQQNRYGMVPDRASGADQSELSGPLCVYFLYMTGAQNVIVHQLLGISCERWVYLLNYSCKCKVPNYS